ncbi:hypothetical protein PODOV026v1_p0004 [Vibrio phage PS32B.1]|nr:hypothetical protein PODOV028v1_20005 [Vibrio phage PS32B.3]QZI86471.1 hypothetical protein PODOV027v1_30005 [Vibrio phage PS35B.3]QZI92177.1 hypothetical protein PODOV026v1_p0004 [Vibrio phage PS32B.1]QZI92282.1 hypothetical protein PODOV004v1_p0047 [Vibrio phage PS32B.11]QZI92301.1 hypothetical protein PODOV025v1_p0004 [Vibrio phage PS32B.6]
MGNMLRFVKLGVGLGHRVNVYTPNVLIITRLNGNHVKVVRLKSEACECHTFEVFVRKRNKTEWSHVGNASGYSQANDLVIDALAELSQ